MSELVPDEGAVEPSPEPLADQGLGTQPEPPSTAPEQGPRQLRRSRTDRVVAGVCGGLGRYLGIDPVLIRIAALVLVFVGGAGIVLYVIGWIAIPEEESGAAMASSASATADAHRGRMFVGLLFVGVGIFYLLDELFPGVDLLRLRYLGPAILIAVGIGVIARART